MVVGDGEWWVVVVDRVGFCWVLVNGRCLVVDGGLCVVDGG